jgi:hypothetical protein
MLGLPEGRQIVAVRLEPRQREFVQYSTHKGVPYMFITRINNVMYRIQRHPNRKIFVVYLDPQASCQKCIQTSGPKEVAFRG